MKEFNKDKELNKLKLKNNKSKYIKYGSIILSVVILLVGIIYFTFAKFESNQSYTLIEGRIGDYFSGDITLSYVVDGVSQSVPPGKNDGYLFKSINCTNGDGTWLNDKWGVEVVNLTGKAKCNIEFEEAVYNNVTKWLATASINKSYTTLSDVFNDTETLNTLTNNNASCDYLKNSTDWINDVTTNENAMTYIGNNDYCADDLYFDDNWVEQIVDSTYWDKILQPLVPIMTSNTTPSGVASASSIYSPQPYTAFNGDVSQTFLTYTKTSVVNTEWIQYQFDNPIKIYKTKVSSVYANYTGNHKIQGSNNGTSWTDLYSWNSNLSNDILKINDKNEYNYYRLYGTTNYTGVNQNNGVRWYHLSVTELQFYGRESN